MGQEIIHEIFNASPVVDSDTFQLQRENEEPETEEREMDEVDELSTFESVNQAKAKAQLMIKVFTLIETKLNLYYLNHTSAPEMDLIVRYLTSSLNKRITVDIVLRITFIWPESFKIFKNLKNNNIYIDFHEQDKSFLKNYNDRNLIFMEKLNDWIIKNGENYQDIPLGKIINDNVCFNSSGQDGKVSKLKNKIIKNSSLKFDFKEKKACDIIHKNLTILQRIKLKEEETAKKFHQSEIISEKDKLDNSKIIKFYDILYTLKLSNINSNSTYINFTLNDLILKIKDSLNVQNGDDFEIEKLLQKLNSILKDEKKIKIGTTKGNLKIVKIGSALNRNHDLKLIQNSTQ
ncbi:hypothetical protein PACTADRAFT_5015 [Pachysolen tannophilus NRRL Y-2460]|uniref:DNA replication factor Cdt1 C-terminal domain-containing protein n=1 Tax=Pachysolen tannophilus NRRL Y-2460 TaxID=669874 RepID=A0A1E4TN90_PACTA|nr:hypothetical protein PACTADRAFT_5015 [Pachysolen tannophilus NRRL Y-2460]